MRRRLIGIAGPSCSGKTSVARAVVKLYSSATVVQADSYYHDLSHLSPADRERQNFDHPEAIEHELLATHLRMLMDGSSINSPRYDFASHTRRTESVRTESRYHIVVEGLYVLHWPEIRGLFDLRVLLWSDHEQCLARRVKRDCRERHRTPEFVRKQYDRDVRPMCDRYLAPTARYADIVIDSKPPLDRTVELACQLVIESLPPTDSVE